MSEQRHCDMAACKTCTGCYHGRHDECRRTVVCPNTGETFTCRCCGSKPGGAAG